MLTTLYPEGISKYLASPRYGSATSSAVNTKRGGVEPLPDFLLPLHHFGSFYILFLPEVILCPALPLFNLRCSSSWP